MSKSYAPDMARAIDESVLAQLIRYCDRVPQLAPDEVKDTEDVQAFAKAARALTRLHEIANNN